MAFDANAKFVLFLNFFVEKFKHWRNNWDICMAGMDKSIVVSRYVIFNTHKLLRCFGIY